MARALQDLEPVATYLEFFGMGRPPFARVSEPAQIFHAQQYSLLYEHLTHASQTPDCLMVICGADGSGKTTLLNRYIASLGHEDFFASFDENCTEATQFHCGLLRQLGFIDINGTLNELRRITREFLIHRGLAGDHVLLVIDNAHLVSPSVLEQIRWLSDIKVKDRRVISIVLSGNSDLPRIMDSPAMRSIRFQDHVDFNIRVYTEQETDEYIRHCLRLAGASESAKLSTEARPLIHRFSGGNPSLINRLCNAVFTEACSQETRVISDELVRSVAATHEFVPHVVPLQGKGRRGSDGPSRHMTLDSAGTEERISPREAPPNSAPELLGSGPDGRDERGIEVTKLLAQVAQLSDELAKSMADKERAIQDIAARDSDINALLNKIAAQTKDFERMATAARKSADEFKQLDQELSGTMRALQISEDDSNKLAADLKIEKAAAKKKKTELAKARQKIEKLEGLKSEIRKSANDLRTELKKTKAETRSELKSRDRTIADLEKSLANVQEECDSLRSDADAVKELEKSLAKAQIECDLLRSDAAAMKELEKSLTEVQKERDSLQSDAAAAKGLEETLAEVQKECDSLRSDADAAKELEKSLAKVQKESDSLRSDADAVKELEKSLAKAQIECDLLRSDTAAMKELEKSLTEVQKERDSLQSDAAAAKELENSLAAVQKECDSLRSDADTAKELEKSLAKVQKECDSLRFDADAAKELEKSLAKVQKECDSLCSDADAAKELENSLAAVQKECDSLRSDAAAVRKLEESVSEKDAHIEELQNELDAYIKKLTATQEMLADERTGSHPRANIGDSAPARPPGAIAAIEVFRDGGIDQVLTIEPGQTRIMIGRSDDSELCLKSKFVSRHHALIFLSDERTCIEDLRSYNGTIVNFKKVTRCDLHPDDKITVGDFQLRPKAIR